MAKSVKEITNSVLGYGFAPNQYTKYIQGWISDANQYLFRRANLRARETVSEYITIANQAAYGLPENFGSIDNVYLTTANSRTRLDPILSQERYDEYEEEKGKPRLYFIGDKLYLYPIPDETSYKVHFRYNLTPSSIAEESSSSPNVGEQYINLIEKYCLWQAFSKEQDIEMGNYWKNQFDLGVVEFTGLLNTDTQQGNDQVEGAWPDGM